MKSRMGAIRGLCLGVVVAGLSAGLGTVSAPAAQGALPGPDSSSWIPVKKGGVVATDPTNDFATGHLNLTSSGGPLADATGFVSADLSKAYFRFHVSELPAVDAVGGYVVQFDTNSSTAGWERALRYSPATRTVTVFSSADNSGVTAPGTAGVTIPSTLTEGTSYAGANGGAFVAFAVPRDRLTEAGIVLGAPMVLGATIDDGVGIDAAGFLGLNNTGDILGVAKSNPAWASAAVDPLDFDSDGDGIADKDDNCPVVFNESRRTTTPRAPGSSGSTTAFRQAPEASRTAPKVSATCATGPRGATTSTRTTSASWTTSAVSSTACWRTAARRSPPWSRPCATTPGRGSSPASSGLTSTSACRAVP